MSVIAGKIGALKDELEELHDEEQSAFDNTPESLQGGERGQAMEEAVEAMSSAMSELDSVADSLNNLRV